jgi:hypothetical protein
MDSVSDPVAETSSTRGRLTVAQGVPIGGGSIGRARPGGGRRVQPGRLGVPAPSMDAAGAPLPLLIDTVLAEVHM